MIDVDAATESVALNVQGTFTADEIRALIQELCKAREAIAKEPDSPVGHPATVTSFGLWYTDFTPDKQSTLLLMRVNGLGWTGITMTPSDRLRLAYYLIGQQHVALNPTAAEAPAMSAGGNTLH